MKAQISIGALALGLMLSGCGGSDDGNLTTAAANTAAPLTQIAAPNNGNWTEIVAETPEGGFRMGNPDAPVKLVEYASITCPHCAEFAEAATDPLENQYVRSGQVSWEYRPYMLFPSDPGIFMLLRCQGATPFFTLVDQLYTSQREWGGRLQSLPPEQLQQLEGLGANARAAALVEASGLDQFFRQRGMPEGRIASCLSDNSGLDRLAEITRAGSQEHGVTGTPTFFINGEKLDVGTWAQLEPRLRMALGG
jgi:protein-disulfide isomerase